MLKKILALLLLFFTTLAMAAVDVNSADQSQLETVKGIGPAISSRIIAERQKGSFKSWQDFIGRVKGVGDKNAAKFSDGGLTVNGAGFDGAAPKAPHPATTAPTAAPNTSTRSTRQSKSTDLRTAVVPKPAPASAATTESVPASIAGAKARNGKAEASSTRPATAASVQTDEHAKKTGKAGKRQSKKTEKSASAARSTAQDAASASDDTKKKSRKKKSKDTAQ